MNGSPRTPATIWLICFRRMSDQEAIVYGTYISELCHTPDADDWPFADLECANVCMHVWIGTFQMVWVGNTAPNRWRDRNFKKTRNSEPIWCKRPNTIKRALKAHDEISIRWERSSAIGVKDSKFYTYTVHKRYGIPIHYRLKYVQYKHTVITSKTIQNKLRWEQNGGSNIK